MELTGTTKYVGSTETVGSGSFQKRIIAVEIPDDKYPQTLAVEFTQDKVNLLDNINVGDTVTIGINLRGREWQSPQGETKYFNTIAGWRIAVTAATQAAPATQIQASDDLPF